MDKQDAPQHTKPLEPEAEVTAKMQELEEQLELLRRIKEIEDPQLKHLMFEKFKRG